MPDGSELVAAVPAKFKPPRAAGITDSPGVQKPHPAPELLLVQRDDWQAVSACGSPGVLLDVPVGGLVRMAADDYAARCACCSLHGIRGAADEPARRVLWAAVNQLDRRHVAAMPWS